MKILKVIHGYPPDYMAGSEVYSYHLVNELHRQGIDISVFTRVENEFHPPYGEYNEIVNDVTVKRVNKPQRDYLYSDKFSDNKIDEIFKSYLEQYKPDIVHFGHLSHLSVKLVEITKNHRIPIVYTIHDFWLFCVKGQLIDNRMKRCSGPDPEKCLKCTPYVTDIHEVETTLEMMRKTVDMIDVFISPSNTLRNFFINQGVSSNIIRFLKYGFETKKIMYRRKRFNSLSKIKWGFMGRIIPTKGIECLIGAFKYLPNETLSIYGSVGSSKRFIESENIYFKGSYNNDEINEVLSEIDVLLVPSIWLENSPLVIQEAILAGVPVITSNIGGMKELIQNGKNGFTFDVGDTNALVKLISKISGNPELLNDLKIERDTVVDIKDDAKAIVKIYQELLGQDYNDRSFKKF